VTEAATLTAIADRRRNLARRRAGGRDGGAFAAFLHHRSGGRSSPLPPFSRALLACAGRLEQHAPSPLAPTASCSSYGATNNARATLPTLVDLSAVAIDTFGRRWAASPGRIWYSDPTHGWRCTHASQAGTSPSSA
jgi:hypothetical protein